MCVFFVKFGTRYDPRFYQGCFVEGAAVSSGKGVGGLSQKGVDSSDSFCSVVYQQFEWRMGSFG